MALNTLQRLRLVGALLLTSITGVTMAAAEIVIRVDQLQMTGLNPGNGVIRTDRIQMTGFASLSEIGVSEAENLVMYAPKSKRLIYPIFPLIYSVERN